MKLIHFFEQRTTRIAEYLYTLGCIIIGFYVISLILTSFFWFCHVTIQAWYLPVFTMLAVLSVYYSKFNLIGKNIKFFYLVLCYILYCIIFGYFSYWMYDTGPDGPWYHTPTQIALASGWNPIYTLNTNIVPIQQFTVQNYAKALEVVRAIIYKSIPFLELSKVSNFITLLACASFSFYFIRKIFNIGFIYTFLFCILINLNPIVIKFLPSSMIDGQIFNFMVIGIGFLVLYLKQHSSNHFIGFLSIIIILIGSKPTTFIFITACGIGLVSYFLIIKKQISKIIKDSFFIAAAVIGSFLLVNYHPYITNYKQYHNFFYPMTFDDKIDIRMNKVFKWEKHYLNSSDYQRWYLEHFIVEKKTDLQPPMQDSSLIRKNNKPTFFYTNQSKFEYRNLLEWNKIKYKKIDDYVNTLGFFWLEIILTSLLILIYLSTLYAKKSLYFIITILLLFGSSAFTPQANLFRFVPQYWLVPIVSLLAVYVIKPFCNKCIFITLLTLLVINIVFINVSFSWANFKRNVAIHQQLQRLQSNPMNDLDSSVLIKNAQINYHYNFIAPLTIFKEKNIKYQFVNLKELDTVEELIYFNSVLMRN